MYEEIKYCNYIYNIYIVLTKFISIVCVSLMMCPLNSENEFFFYATSEHHIYIYIKYDKT